MSNMKKQPTKTITEILATPIFGDAMSDGELMSDIDDFVLNIKNNVEDKIKALDFMSHDIMGIDDAPTTLKDVANYISQNEVQFDNSTCHLSQEAAR